MLNNLHVLLCLSLCLSSSFSFFFEILLSHNAEKLGKFEKSSLLGFYDFGRTFFCYLHRSRFSFFVFISKPGTTVNHWTESSDNQVGAL